jgi:hypothetical protein
MTTNFITKIPAYCLLIAGLFVFSCQDQIEEPTMENVSLEVNSSFQGGEVIPGQFIVVFNDNGAALRKSFEDYSTSQINMRKEVVSLLSKYRIAEEHLLHVFSSSIEGFAVKLTKEQLSQLTNDPLISYVEPDRIASLFQQSGNNGSGVTTQSTQEVPFGINRVGGAVSYLGSQVAWVLDTGIELTHPDLNINANRGFTAFTKGRDANLNDLNGHGTHVAGTIAALDNTIGVVGVAAGAQVIPVKVLDGRGSGSNSGVIAGVDFVKANGKAGDVANMSLGGGISTALDNAVINASAGGIKFVLAAGNSGADANTSSPARANGPNIYTISAMDSRDVFASFSNYGNPPVDYCAPGVAIKSTWLKGGYNTISGTSMAAPHAAGVLLLGAPKISGYVKNDKDNSPDPIISHR